MKKLLQELIDNDSGLILSAELVLILTIAVLGIIVGLVQLQTAIITELQDISLAFSGMNQSFSTPGFVGCRKIWGTTSFTAGSGFIDFYNHCIGTSGFGGGVGGWGGGGGYAEIGGGGYTVSQGMSGGATVIAPQTTTIPCDTCTPETFTGTPTPEHTNLAPPGPISGPNPLPPPPAPVPHHE